MSTYGLDDNSSESTSTYFIVFPDVSPLTPKAARQQKPRSRHQRQDKLRFTPPIIHTAPEKSAQQM
jgi:hypothetical protein